MSALSELSVSRVDALDVKLHDNADVSAAVNVSGDSAVNDDETSDAQLLADDEDLLLESRVNSLVAACDRVSEERVNVSGLVREDGVEKSVRRTL